MENYIELKNIDKWFGAVHALDNVSLGIKKGELVSFVGENGAGKSTLMKILAGVFPMDHGEIWINGSKARIVNTKSAFQYGIGQDEFDHEQYLVITEGSKKVLISGCAHNGILNILDHYYSLYDSYPDAVISGFHMRKKTDYTEEDMVIHSIQKYKEDGHSLTHEYHIRDEVTGEQLTGTLEITYRPLDEVLAK